VAVFEGQLVCNLREATLPLSSEHRQIILKTLREVLKLGDSARGKFKGLGHSWTLAEPSKVLKEFAEPTSNILDKIAEMGTFSEGDVFTQSIGTFQRNRPIEGFESRAPLSTSALDTASMSMDAPINFDGLLNVSRSHLPQLEFYYSQPELDFLPRATELSPCTNIEDIDIFFGCDAAFNTNPGFTSTPSLNPMNEKQQSQDTGIDYETYGFNFDDYIDPHSVVGQLHSENQKPIAMAKWKTKYDGNKLLREMEQE